MDQQKPAGKPFEISKWEVWDAYRQVKANQGAAGVDGCTIEAFEEDLKNNLYKIWNRLSSGSYFPPAVKAGRYPSRTAVGSGSSVCRRSAYSARSVQPNAGSEFVVVTHPFHPLAGQRLEVLFERRMPAGLAYSCDGGALGRMLLPATWTDREMPEQSTRLSYEALVELARVIAALRGS